MSDQEKDMSKEELLARLQSSRDMVAGMANQLVSEREPLTQEITELKFSLNQANEMINALEFSNRMLRAKGKKWEPAKAKRQTRKQKPANKEMPVYLL